MRDAGFGISDLGLGLRRNEIHARAKSQVPHPKSERHPPRMGRSGVFPRSGCSGLSSICSWRAQATHPDGEWETSSVRQTAAGFDRDPQIPRRRSLPRSAPLSSCGVRVTRSRVTQRRRIDAGAIGGPVANQAPRRPRGDRSRDRAPLLRAGFCISAPYFVRGSAVEITQLAEPFHREGRFAAIAGYQQPLDVFRDHIRFEVHGIARTQR